MSQTASVLTREQSAPVAGASLHQARRLSQWLTILILILVPLTGLLRLDLTTASITMLDRQIWFSDIFIVLGLMIVIGGLLAIINSILGSVFCGWVCPQNSVSELANTMTVKLLGRRAQMLDITGAKMQVANRRQSPVNYLLLAAGLVVPAMLFAIIPLLYFYPPETILSFLRFSEAALEDGSLYWIYGVSFALFLFDIAAVRHLVCKHFCAYRVWQNAFKNKQTLRIRYDDTRSDHCNSCNYCADACFVDIDPRRTGGFDGCVGCGECVTACADLHQRSKKLAGPGLLRFGMGDEQVSSRLSGTVKPVLATAVGSVLFIIGIIGYQSNEFSVYRKTDNSYRISIAHKLYRPAEISVKLQGLPAEAFHFDNNQLHFESVGRKELILHIDQELVPGLHRFRVIASADDGWSHAFSVTHLGTQAPVSGG